MDFLFLVARILMGSYFIYNSYAHLVKGSHMVGYAQSKKVPFPKMAIFVSGALLLLGGLGILFWAYVSYAVLALVLFLVPVTFMMHNFWQITDPQSKMMEQIQFTKNMALLGGVLMALFV